MACGVKQINLEKKDLREIIKFNRIFYVTFIIYNLDK